MTSGTRVAIGFGILILAPVGWYLWTGQLGPIDFLKQSRRLEDAIARSKELGLPMLASDLDPNPPVPDAENAALVVVPVINKALSGPNYIDSDSLLPGRDPKIRALTISMMKPYSNVLREVKAGLKRKHWHIKRDWDLGPNVLFPEFAKVKSASRLLAADAVQRALSGDQDGALESLVAGRTLARHTATEPSTIGFLVSVASDTIMLRAAEQLIEVWRADDLALSRLAKTIEATSYHFDPRIAWRGEFYQSLSTARNLHQFGGLRRFGTEAVIDPDPFIPIRTGLPRPQTTRANLTPILDYWNDVFTKFGKEAPAAGTWGTYLDRRSEAETAQFATSKMLAVILLPDIGRADFAHMRHELLPQMTLALIRVAQFKLKTGNYPKSLAEVGVSFPDLFGQGEVNYGVVGKAVQIWSIGDDRIESGGPIGGAAPDLRRNDPGVVFPSSARPARVTDISVLLPSKVFPPAPSATTP